MNKLLVYNGFRIAGFCGRIFRAHEWLAYQNNILLINGHLIQKMHIVPEIISVARMMV